jgi:hypothetical protein
MMMMMKKKKMTMMKRTHHYHDDHYHHHLALNPCHILATVIAYVETWSSVWCWTFHTAAATRITTTTRFSLDRFFCWYVCRLFLSLFLHRLSWYFSDDALSLSWGWWKPFFWVFSCWLIGCRSIFFSLVWSGV